MIKMIKPDVINSALQTENHVNQRIRLDWIKVKVILETKLELN